MLLPYTVRDLPGAGLAGLMRKDLAEHHSHMIPLSTIMHNHSRWAEFRGLLDKIHDLQVEMVKMLEGHPHIFNGNDESVGLEDFMVAAQYCGLVEQSSLLHKAAVEVFDEIIDTDCRAARREELRSSVENW